MALKVGDKCPQCKEGLLERTDMGMACSDCAFDMEIEAVMEANKREETEVGEYKYRAARVSVRIDSPETGEEFLRGLILAKQNNNSPLFGELVDGINQVLEPWRAARLRAEMNARAAAGMR